MKSKRLSLVMLVTGLLITLTPLTSAAAPSSSSPSQEPEPECSPMALRLSERMGVECSVLMDYQANDVGFGVIMKAYSLSQIFPDLDWEDLVDRHTSEEGLGWGQITKAYRLASQLDLNAEDLLAERAQGSGWGEILQQYREGPGKPPWAEPGPPPWANQHPGKPPWAGGPHRNKE
jgi:hypothetical protein